MRGKPGRESVFGPIPPAVFALAAVAGGAELILSAFQLGIWQPAFSSNLRADAVNVFGFSPWLFREQFESAELISLESVRLVTYPFVHFGWMHTLFSAMFILALGSVLSNFVRGLLVPVSFFAASAISAVIYAWFSGADFPLLGAAPGYLGLLGLLAGILLMMHGHGHPAASPSMVSFPFLLIGLKLTQDTLFGLPGYMLANASGFVLGFLVSLIAIPGGFLALSAGLKRLFGK